MGREGWDCLRAVAWSVEGVRVLDGVTTASDEKKAPERGAGGGGVLKGGGLGGASVFQKKEEGGGEETPLDRLQSSAAEATGT